MRNIMIDLETMGTDSDAAIVSIGAVEFSHLGLGRTFYSPINLQSNLEDGRSVTGSTIEFWLKQDEAARLALCDIKSSLRTILYQLSDWMPADPIVWGNGATFDNVILANAYKALEISVPWKFYNDRCYRTLKALCPEIETEPFIGTKHNALADAVHQAKHAVRCLQALESK